VGFYQLDNAKETRTAAVREVQDGLTLRLPFKEQPYALLPVGAAGSRCWACPTAFLSHLTRTGTM
jgi:hypothetical protein